MSDQELRIKISVDKKTGAIKVANSEFNELNNSVKKTDESTNTFNDSLSSIAKAAAGVYVVKQAFDAAAGSLSALITTASTFERQKSILKTLEGDSIKAEKSFEWIKDFTSETPYQLEQVGEAFLKAKAYGIDPTNGTLETLGDTAAGMGKDLMQAVEAMADAMTGENERLKEFGIKAKVIGEEVAYNWTSNSGKAKHIVVKNNSEIIQSTLNAIFNSKYDDAMQDQMDTWIGITSNFSDSWTNMLNDVATKSGVFDAVKFTVSDLSFEFKELTGNKEDMEELYAVVRTSSVGAAKGFEALSNVVIGGVYVFETVDMIIDQVVNNAKYGFYGMQEAWLEMIYEIQLSANNVLPDFMKDTLGIDDKDIEQSRIELNKMRQTMADIEIDAAKREVSHYEYVDGLVKIKETIGDTVDNLEKYTLELDNNTESKEKNKKSDFGEDGSYSQQATSKMLSTSISDWKNYFETIGDYDNAWLIEAAELSDRYVDLSEDQYKKIYAIAKKEYFDKINKMQITDKTPTVDSEIDTFIDKYFDPTKMGDKEFSSWVEKSTKEFNDSVDNGDLGESSINFGDHIARSVTDGVQDAFDGDFDFSSLTQSLASSMGSAMMGAGMSQLTSGMMASMGPAAAITGGVALLGASSTVDGVFGGGSSYADRHQSFIDAIDSQTKSIVDTLDKQTEVLSRLGYSSDALEKSNESAYETFIGELSKTIYDIYYIADDTGVSNWTDGNGNLTTETEDNYSSFKDWFESTNQMANLTLENMVDGDVEIATNAVNDYILVLFDTVDAYSDLSDSLKTVYDSLNDNYYANLELAQAQSIVNDLRGDSTFDEYLYNTITALDEYGLTIASLENDLTSGDFETQTNALAELEAATGESFDNNTADALDYLDSIELVGEAMATSKANIEQWNDSFKTQDEIVADMADSYGVSVAKTQDDLNLLFESMSTDIDGLTDAELDFLEANQDLIDSLQEYTDALYDSMMSVTDYANSLLDIADSSTDTQDTLATADMSYNDKLFYYASQANDAYDDTKSLISDEASIDEISSSYNQFVDYIDTLIDSGYTDYGQLSDMLDSLNTDIYDASDELLVKVSNASDIASDSLTQEQLESLGLSLDESTNSISGDLDAALQEWADNIETSETTTVIQYIQNTTIDSSDGTIAQSLTDATTNTDYVDPAFEAWLSAFSLEGFEGTDLSYNTDYTITPFADGGIVTAPTLGLVGEAGYNEAIIPLKDPNDPLQTKALLDEIKSMKEEQQMTNAFLAQISSNTDTDAVEFRR